MRILKSNRRLIPWLALLALLTLNLQPSTAYAQGTAFTYQGRLNDGGSPAHGTYDLRFAIYDAASAGSQQGNLLTNSATSVSNGLFTVTLDFGNQFPGAARWLEIGVRTNGAGSFFTLSPRQPLTPAPYAITAGNVTGGGLAAGTYGNAVTFSNGANSFAGTFTGNGANVTNVNAATLGGLAPSSFWQLGGNPVLTGQFVGSVNNQPLDLRVNNLRVMELAYASNSASGYSPNVIGGNSANSVSAGVVGATIGGGGSVSGSNYVTADFATVVGGMGCKATNSYAVAAGNQSIAGGYASTAMGYKSSAIGTGSTAMGNASSATAFGSTAMGYDSSATGFGSTAVGFSVASGLYSTAMGLSDATGDYSTAMGNLSVASGTNSTAMGNSSATNSYATAMGHSSAYDAYSTAMGQSTASGYSATAMGGGTATGEYSTALGYAFAYGDYSTALGGSQFMAAEADGASSFASGPGAKAAYDYSFVWNDSYGTLPYASSGPDQFLIHAHGGVGIGLTNPAAALHVASQTTGTPQVQLTQQNSSDSVRLRMNSGSNVGWEMDVTPGSTPQLQIWYVGAAGPRMTIDTSGNVSATSFNPTSDRNAKENFSPVDARDMLDKVATLPITRWNYKTDTNTVHVGPMAQDFHATFNVGPDEKHIATVDEEGVALAAIQGLNQRLNEKDDEIRRLKESVAQLHELVSQLAKSQSRPLSRAFPCENKKQTPGHEPGCD